MPSVRRLTPKSEARNIVGDFLADSNEWKLRKSGTSAICAPADKICHASGKEGETVTRLRSPFLRNLSRVGLLRLLGFDTPEIERVLPS